VTRPGGNAGAVIWHAAGSSGAGRPAADDSTVFFVARADSHVVHAFDIGSGLERWSTPTGAINGGSYSLSGCVLAQRLVVCGDITDVVAFNRSDGHYVWRYRSPGQSPGVFPSTVDSAGTTVYAPTETGEVDAIDASNGQARWVAHFPSTNYDLYKILDGGDVVIAPFTIFGTQKDTGGVVALAKTDGSVRWLTRFPLIADWS
jgi:outer membrane protein assembly factor BamB